MSSWRETVGDKDRYRHIGYIYIYIYTYIYIDRYIKIQIHKEIYYELFAFKIMETGKYYDFLTASWKPPEINSV